MVNNIYKIIY